MAHDHSIFLDHAATTPVHPQVLGLMLPFFGNHFAAPASPFTAGDTPRAALEQARGRVARLIGAQPSEIVFTASGTEANNLALLGRVGAMRGHVIVSAVEHPSVLHAAHHLRGQGIPLTVLPVDADGLVSPASVQGAIRDDTVLISLQHASQETGVIQPACEIGRMARARGIAFHCDCIQSAGRIAVDVNTLHADLLAVSSHKLYGPKGAGALYVRQGTAISPILFGSSRENSLRPGTLDIPAVVGFGRACEEALAGLEKNAAHVKTLRDRLDQLIAGRLPGVTVNGSAVERLPHVSSISFEGVQADSLAAWLDLRGITASPRASIFSKSSSPALSAMHIRPDLAFGTVRFSPGWENTASEIELVAEAVVDAVAALRDFARHVEKGPVCIATLLSKDHVERSLGYLRENGIPCAVTARPAELAHLPGPSIALAVPCQSRTDMERILHAHRIAVSGTHDIRGLCRVHAEQEQGFWDGVDEIGGKRDHE